MPLKFVECFGLSPDSEDLGRALKLGQCPFVGEPCSKRFKDGPASGACTLAKSSDGMPVICCPKRLYAENYKVLRDIVRIAFGTDVPLVLDGESTPVSGCFAIPFGQRQGREIRISHSDAEGASKFSVDWILALVSESRSLEEFVAVEVQTIDTTGNYQKQFWDIADVHCPMVVKRFRQPKASSSSFNFENVNKRILPQLITKGHILRRETRCRKGLFFVCPSRVFDGIIARVGNLHSYPIQPGAITLLAYDLGPPGSEATRPLAHVQTLTTTTDQLSLAFSSPRMLPEAGVYEKAIEKALEERLQRS